MAASKTWSHRRQFWVRLHRWLGLGLLGFWLVIGLTGSVLVVYREVLTALHSAAGGAQPVQAAQPLADPAQGIDLDRVHQSLRRSHPDRHGAWRLELPLKPGEPIVARYMKPVESADRAFAPLMVWVDPYTAVVGHEAIWGDEPLTWLYDLHYSLLLDLDGRQLVGALGVLMTVSLVSGLVLWWPRSGGWPQAWRFKRGAAIERQVYDWHKLTGLASAVVLLMLAATGMALTWHQPLAMALHRVGPVFHPPAVVVKGPPVVSLAQAVSLAGQCFPQARLRWVESAPVGGGLIRVQLWQVGEPSRRFPRTQVWVDAATAEVVAVRDGLQDSPADTLMAWLHPLHNGEVAGWPGRILVLLSGLAPVPLGLTGWLRWRHKARARALAQARAGVGKASASIG
ncbi:PepSY domain-containing protein [Aquabacterium sp.]|uniref:PepSY-associated TM helix domain-containing protein n=1 Tax=Aquabacterium sp. TaxID=1872578 RepID=UPI0025C71AEB|nr:PepSY-associated TM helix domain-containing protein [Aquabacterium sp.]